MSASLCPGHHPIDDLGLIGSPLPCGCIHRAVEVVCLACSRRAWFACPTKTAPGRQVTVLGTCPYCDEPADQWATVYEHPIPDAFHRA